MASVIAENSFDFSLDYATGLLTLDLAKTTPTARVSESDGAILKASVKAIDSDTIEVKPFNSPIESIIFGGVDISKQLDVGLDVVDAATIKDIEPVKAYAIDPTKANFTSAIVKVIAAGTDLYKCKDWDFAKQNCYGNWTLFKKGLVPGQEYSFELAPEDPGFAEVNATDAEHLDENRNLISNIYPEIAAQDDVWSEPIYAGQYVRVKFAENLTNGNVIDLYIRNLQGLNTSVETVSYTHLTLPTIYSV